MLPEMLKHPGTDLILPVSHIDKEHKKNKRKMRTSTEFSSVLFAIFSITMFKPS